MRPTEGFKQLGRGLGFRPFGRGPTITDGRRKYTIVPALLFAPPMVIFTPPPFCRVQCFAHNHRVLGIQNTRIQKSATSISGFQALRANPGDCAHPRVLGRPGVVKKAEVLGYKHPRESAQGGETAVSCVATCCALSRLRRHTVHRHPPLWLTIGR